jgi:hypothetical protein
MSISNRLKKMEETLNIDSEFCGCRRHTELDIEYQEDGKPPTSDWVLRDAEEEKAKSALMFCETCAKKIRRQTIIVDWVTDIREVSQKQRNYQTD